MSGWDVLLGGALTLVGTGVTEVTRAKIAKRDRQVGSKTASDEFEHNTLTQLGTAAGAYRRVLLDVNAELVRSNDDVSAATTAKLELARVAFQAVVYMAVMDVQKPMLRWEAVAVKWSQRDGSAAEEDKLWREAMDANGKRAKKLHNLR